ncbi:Poly-glutamine tract binding protein 1 [Strongyloides ratti]|uniref:Poly-glutamine tract binding protein 1 n=1 Tax=Strongyloides ratti TaxID=34506 RepID=A0A090MTR1_STRRB|nr:Poly-glutamine tract binding protein 1 [Strongyloides ratti]CEF61693.1 Poly-glutamine tract binding protein 1 [Strongyloides ratti]
MFSQFRMVGSPIKKEYDLEITNVTMWNDGFYECQVTSSKNNNNFEKTKPAYLKVLKLPEDYEEGVPIEEICFLSKTHPTPKFYWVITKSGTLDNILSWIGNGIPDDIYDKYSRTLSLSIQSGQIHKNSSFNSKNILLFIDRKFGDEQIIHEGSNFTIKNVQKWQTGEYECVATNNFKPVILSHNLFIEGDFQVRANDTVFVNHESISTLSCGFHEYPKPSDII